MKKTVLYITFIILAFIACKKDATVGDKSYSYLKILEPINNNSSGVTLQAEIIKQGSEDILDYGFLYGLSTNELTQVSLYGTHLEDGIFSKRFTMEFNPSKSYYVMAYVQHLGLRVLTSEMKLKTNGGTNPVISTITPNEIFRGETIEIKGKYFSKTGNNEVEIAGETAYVTSSTDTNLVVRTPSWIFENGNVTVKIVADDWRTTTSSNLTIVQPEIYSIEPLSAFAGDIVKIRGEYLSHDSYSTSLFFSNRQAEIVSKSLEELEVLVPGGFYNPDLQDRIIDEIKLEISNFEHTYETNFTIFNQWRKSNDLNMQPAYLTETVVLDLSLIHI